MLSIKLFNVKPSILKFLAIVMISATSFALQAATVNFKELTVKNLTKEDQSWFMEAFPKGFMAVYRDKVFVITKDGKSTILGPMDVKAKKAWLLKTAGEEFQDYVLAPKKGYKAFLIEYEKKPIGALLYRLLENEKTVYLAQFFIVPDLQKRGIGSHIILNTVPNLHPNYKRYEILARQQNDAALLFYKKAGFLIGDIELVKKYDYDPLRYMSFYKDN